MKPKFSVIVANYNKGDFIANTLEYLRKQTFENFEAIIVDDASTDNSIEIVAEFCNSDPRFKLIKNASNVGANTCRNKAINDASGEYIIFCDSDDLLDSECLATRYQVILQNLDYDLWVFTMAVFKEKIGDDIRVWKPKTDDALGDFLSHKLPWSIMQPAWKRSTLLFLNGFDENFSRLQDVELHTRALMHKDFKYFLCAGEPDCYYRIGENRKNFNSDEFFNRWISAALQYCDKFHPLLKKAEKKKLIGTVFQTYLSLILAYKEKQLSYSSFQILENKILQTPDISLYFFARQIIRLVRFYNLHFPRIPGFNRLLKYCLV